MKIIHPLLLIAALPLVAQSSPASAPAPAASAPAAACSPAQTAGAAAQKAVPQIQGSHNVVYVPTGNPDEAVFLVKRAQILLAEERRDPAMLASLYADPDPQLRARAARAAGRIGAPDAAAHLAKLLADPDPGVRAGAAWGALYLGENARPLLPALRAMLPVAQPGRLPAMETITALNDAAATDAVLRELGQDSALAGAVAGHLFHLDQPRVREFLRATAGKADNPAAQYGALYSMIRLKIEDEAFYCGLLPNATGETAVVILKGLGLTKTWSPETKVAVEAATQKKADPPAVIEAFGALLKHDYEGSDAISRLLNSDYSPQDSQLMLKIYDEGSQLDCDNYQGFGGLTDFIYFHPNLIFSNTKSMGSIDYSLPPERPGMPTQLLRRYLSKGIACSNSKDQKTYFNDYRKLFDNLQKASYPTFRLYQAIADGFSENPDDHAKELGELAHSTDARVRTNAISALVTKGEAVDPFLNDPDPEVVANSADAAAKWKKFPKEKISAKALAKAYDRFNAKDAPDGPTVRLYLVRLAAACASEQPGCKALLKRAIAKDRERAVQIDGWTRWPATLAGKPEWPKPNLPKPDFSAATANLAALVVKVPRFEVETTQGKFTMAFSARGESPLNVLNFRDLVAKKFFDGISWHRVVPNFVVQGGDPRGDGSGGPGHFVPCEYNSFPYAAGTVGMALDGKDTGGSQFFIALTRVPHLDYHYTVLGQVESGGLATLYKLGEDDKIISIRELE